MRLIAACELTRCNSRWSPVIRIVKDQHKALMSCRKCEEIKVPNTNKVLSVIKLSELFTDFLCRVVGIKMIPLAYVVNDSVAPVRPLPPLAQDSPHLEDHGSIKKRDGVACFACSLVA